MQATGLNPADDAQSTFTVISPSGDLILEVQEEHRAQNFSYRVDSISLQQTSPYFTNLLHPDKFGEGADYAKAVTQLRKTYDSIDDVPDGELPRVTVSDVGKISKVSSIQLLMADFLRSLHNIPLESGNPPVINLANLAVVADRFNALAHLRKYVRRNKYLQIIDGRTRHGASTNITEEKCRQKLLVGVMLDHAPWVGLYSKRLILRDSIRWRPTESPEDPELALWWDLPNGLEDELLTRREYVLETINSLQSHFLKLYSSGERQCKLGYDSSLQCDTYQFGEMVRFFLRLDTLRLQGKIYNAEEPCQYHGDIDRLLETLRQCPSYQIDRNHTHCGLRTRIIPLLDLIHNYLTLDTSVIDIGICADCWQNHRPAYSWYNARRPVLWTRPMLSSRRVIDSPQQGSLCLARHMNVRDVFMAADRDWTATDTSEMLRDRGR